MRARTIDCIVGGISALFTVFGFGYAFGTQRKLNQVSERLDAAIADMSKDVKVEIQEEVTYMVLEKACEAAAEKAIKAVQNEVVSEYRNDIRKAVKDEVLKQSLEIKDKVTEEITRQAAYIDISELREKVVKEATSQTMSKLDGCLDSVLEKHNAELRNVGRIYQSIADSMTSFGRKE